MRYLFAIILLLNSLQVLCQGVETPEILSVSIDSISGCPMVTWQVDNPQSVDGYVVKRLIYDGVGVMPDTYNNVAVIEDNSVCSWIDNSTDYSTSAKPSERIECYRVAAFVRNGDKIKYSLMSDEMSTIMIFVLYDQCTKRYTLKWTGNNRAWIEKYYIRSSVEGVGVRVAEVLNDTTMECGFDDYSRQRSFTVEAVLKNGHSMFSTTAYAYAPKEDEPEMTISTVSVNDQNQLDITVSVSESKDVNKTMLVRRFGSEAGNETDTIALPLHTEANLMITDTDADVTKRYDYWIVVYGGCGLPLSVSSFCQNIVLNVSTDGSTSNHLSWNPMPGVSTEDFVIYSIDESGKMSSVVQYVSGETEFTHNLSYDIVNQSEVSGKFCYQVAQTYFPSAGSDNAAAYSNVVCVEREPVVFVPNALNPDADIIDNRYFRPLSGFLNNYKLSIYNKRGELLFSTTDIELGWDGKNSSGKLYPPDSYVYIISYKTSAGKSKQLSGFIDLVY